jgi:cephalosporin-C deacetylase-like acetyl esterase
LYLVPHSLWKFGAENTIAIRIYNDSGLGGIIADSIDLRTVTLIDQMKVSGKVYNDLGVFPRNDSVKVDVSVINHSSRVARVNLVIEAETDAGVPAYSEVWPFTLYPAKSIQYTYAHLPESPGFYKYMVYLEKDGVRGAVHRFMVGYDPENIPSSPDIIPDLSSFWGKALQDLSAVTPAYRVSLLPAFSSQEKNVYEVEMQSLGFVRIKGYYSVPKTKKKEKFPAIVEFTGYGSDPEPLSGTDDGFVRMVLSVRGQGLNKADTTYGEFLLHGLDSLENYYYRGAYMDLIRGMDFVFSRPEVDTLRVAVTGGGQGGSFALAAAALDKRIKAAVFHGSLLSDFANYFSIAHWPRSLFSTYLEERPEMNMEGVLGTLSYFDVKNLADRIQCPVLMGVGLQDSLSPARVNFSVYNRLRSLKEYVVYPEQYTGVREEFYPYTEAWIRKILRVEEDESDTETGVAEN